MSGARQRRADKVIWCRAKQRSGAEQRGLVQSRVKQRGDLVQAAGSHVTFLPPLEL